MRQLSGLGCAMTLAMAASGQASAAPVDYTAYLITDGQLGSWTFSQARVTLQFRADTENTVATTVNGATVYRNDHGHATVVITQGAKTVVADLGRNQIYVRYDPVNGSAGFGSYAVGSLYPIALGCEKSPATCNPADVVSSTAAGSPGQQTLQALVDLNAAYATDSGYYSSAVPGLETNLKGPALLTGYAIACASYDFINGSCPSNPGTPITTDQGDLYFHGQDYSQKGIFTAVLGEQDDD